MADDEPKLVLLLETEDLVKLAAARSLLDAEGVSYVVQGELHGAMVAGLFGNPAIAPRILVDRDHLERARKLLDAQPLVELEGVCAVHEKPATRRCSRCQAFLCDQCEVKGVPPLCEACASGGTARHEQRARSGKTLRKAVAWMMLAPILLSIAALLVTVILRVVGVLPLKP